MKIITLQPYQAVRLYGWFSRHLKTSLAWSDVCTHSEITMQLCIDNGISLANLKLVQPSLLEWKKHGSLCLTQLPKLSATFDAHPVKDLQADLADIISMRWSASELHDLGVTYQDLLDIGMVAGTMRLFGYSLLGWITLGFTCQDMQTISDADIYLLFGMSKMNAERCFGIPPTQ